METTAAFIAFALLFVAWIFAPSQTQEKAQVAKKRDGRSGFLRPSQAT